MKDAYSFHASQECLDREYENMAQAYSRIFERCGLETRMVRSDSGAIGGKVSHEFMVLTRTAEGEQESGENDVFFCDACGYAANVERAESVLPEAVTDGIEVLGAYSPNQEVETPACDTIEKLCAFLKCPPSLICKTLLYIKDEQTPLLVLIRGDREVEETKLKNAVEALELRLATAEEVERYCGTVKGYVGIGRLSEDMNLSVIVDESIASAQSGKGLKNFVIGYMKENYHLVRFNWPETPKMAKILQNVRDVGAVQIGDHCAECAAKGQTALLQMTRGIEVGNIFQLGQRYSESMNATYTAEDGAEQPFIMGCYGIGVSRTAAAAIERFHDASGIIWPMAIAPYHVVVCPVNVQDDTQRNLAESVYERLQAEGVEVVLDNRDERAGVKFKDADLLGFPIRITVGKKAAEGLLEVKMRDQAAAVDLPLDEVPDYVRRQVRQWHPFSRADQPAVV